MCYFVLFLSFFLANDLYSQNLDFPVGVGAVGVGYRHYMPTKDAFDNQGQIYPLNSLLNRELNGETLLNGAGGDDMQKLARELLKWDGGIRRPGDLLDDLNLGRLEADIKSEVQVQLLSVVMGVYRNFTAYMVLPFVKAQVDVDVRVVGENNAAAIIPRLSEFAYDDLSEGLLRASQLTGDDVVQGIMDLGYKDPRRWTYDGVGDLLLGNYYNYAFVLNNRNHTSAVRTTLTIPTGPYDDPDALTDISLSDGYYLLHNQWAANFSLRPSVFFATFAGLGLGLPTQVKKRVPENDEEFVSIERKSNVRLTPGVDFNYGLEPSYRLGWFTFLWELGAKHHTKDRYSGGLAGNYEKLAEESDTYILYQEAKLRMETVQPFVRGEAFVPIVTQLSAYFPIKGRNTMNQIYYELGVALVFTTPYYEPEEAKKKQRKTRPRPKT